MKHIKNFKQLNESLDFNKSRSRIFIRKYMDDKDTKDYWHILTEMGYKEWQDESSEVKGLSDMLDYSKEKFGELVEFAILLANYIGQVNNGGHAQYYSNGYAGSGGGGFSDHGDDMSNHHRLIQLFNELSDDLSDNNWYNKLMDIMEDFDIELDDERYEEGQCEDCNYGQMECEECYGSGEIDGDEESEECGSCDGQGSVECSSCDGSGNTEYDNENYNQPTERTKEEWDKLDSRLYALDSEIDFDKQFNEYFKKRLEL